METELREAVRRRAADACEYCRIPQAALSLARFHLEHIVARQHGGTTTLENLALACGRCNLFKGPNIASLDPFTGQLVPLFHPRRDRWTDHFEWKGTMLVGRTPVGRATVQLLAINDWQRLDLREFLASVGESYSG